VEGLLLTVKQMLGAARQFVFTPEGRDFKVMNRLESRRFNRARSPKGSDVKVEGFL